MVETAGVNQVPAVKRIEAVPWIDKRRDIGTGLKERAKGRIKSVIQNGRENQNSKLASNIEAFFI